MEEKIEIEKSYILNRINELRQHPVLQEYSYLVSLIKPVKVEEEPKTKDDN